MQTVNKTSEEYLVSARKELLADKQLLIAGIKAYPRPIAGCDAQFNYLLKQRNMTTIALDILNKQMPR